MRNGRRWSASDAFLRPAIKRPNLDILTNCTVNKIYLSDNRAVKLQIIREDDIKTIEEIHIAGELILSAGTIGSPALLLKSGIGPADNLQKMGLETIINLDRVGRNLHDHPAIAVNTNAPTMMIAEKATDIILAENK